ncbi:L-fucose:H+ symporter permease [Psychrobium sp. MM17-31]|uniref:L-fucose:H+ symporter permease n=1 Tax=Psychrobium sp. MM17-31 TaxID=2917758 RepID=UPI001EF44E7A|nr:L-fucose:H+ symporter permease [Psychrobium sp. MM17-31]MCG7532409.1 L-fucose:H+ symporter permease [Psychrobium sp. MM17-31]
MSIATSSPNATSSQPNNGYGFALVSLTSLFFMWGFITCLNDILIPHLQSVFSLTHFQAMLIQFCFFGAYFIVSIPAGILVKRIGYKGGIVTGLIIAAIGCLLFYPAASMQEYAVFLGALFVLASGITILQVAANPYVTALGPEKTAASRLNLTQALNSFGTTIAPWFGSLLILSAVAHDVSSMTDAQRLAQAESVQMPYILLASMLLILAAIFSQLKLPVIDAIEDTSGEVTDDSAWNHRHLVLGAVGIFMYVGAEVAIGSFLVNFFGLENIAGLNHADAAKYLTYFWGGAMVGRFIGAAVMQKLAAGKVLAFNAGAAVLLLVITIIAEGQLAMYAVLLIGLCNSIMFPTIFSLGVAGLGKVTSQGSGILCLAIVGGALIPPLQGLMADAVGIQLSFALPLICYIYIAYYGLIGSKVVPAKK